MELGTLKELYVDGLKDLYSAESQILKALPEMEKAATAPDLKAGFAEHRRQTEEQVARLEQIFEKLGKGPNGKHCKGMEGLLEEGKELMQEKADPQVLDAGLIAAAQHVEHYEMAGYGTCRTYARLLGDQEAADLLQRTLDEEQETDLKLTRLAEGHINVEAL
jgi:ferritin-like metal-binding protein YciE